MAASVAAMLPRFRVPHRLATTDGATKLKRLDLVSSSFTDLRTAKVPFVDKTSGIADLLLRVDGESAITKRAFFTRPRKFGKSLSLSTARVILESGDLPTGVSDWRVNIDANKEALKGTAVNERYQRGELGKLLSCPHFVVSLSLSGASTGTELKVAAMGDIADIAGSAFGPELEAKVLRQPNLYRALRTLIRAVPRQVPVALLVDEYDAAVIQDLERGRWDEAETAVEALRSLLMVTKTDDVGPRIHHCIVTGVARFTKESILSGVNHFKDLTNNPLLGAVIGFTDAEIRASFPDHLARLAANETGGSVDAAMAELARWYNGHCFDGVTTCFNPYGVLSSLEAGKVDRTSLEGSASTGWLGLPPMTILDSLKEEERVPLVQNEVKKLAITDWRNRRLHALPLLMQVGLLTLVPQPATAAVPPLSAAAAAAAATVPPPSAAAVAATVPLPGTATLPPRVATATPFADTPAPGSQLFVVPNQYARMTLLQMAMANVHGVVFDAWWAQVTTSLHTRNTAEFSAACGTLLQGVSYDVASANPGTGKGATAEQVAEAVANKEAAAGESVFQGVLYAMLRAASGATGIAYSCEHSVQAGRADAVIMFRNPDTTWIIEVGLGKDSETMGNKVRQGKDYAGAFAGDVLVCALIVTKSRSASRIPPKGDTKPAVVVDAEWHRRDGSKLGGWYKLSGPKPAVPTEATTTAEATTALATPATKATPTKATAAEATATAAEATATAAEATATPATPADATPTAEAPASPPSTPRKGRKS